MTDVLHAVAELLYGPGEPLNGFAGDEAQAEVEAILNFNGKPYCLVRDWIIIEGEVDDRYRDELAAAGFDSNVLYASNVRVHSAGKGVSATCSLCSAKRKCIPLSDLVSRVSAYGVRLDDVSSGKDFPGRK